MIVEKTQQSAQGGASSTVDDPQLVKGDAPPSYHWAVNANSENRPSPVASITSTARKYQDGPLMNDIVFTTRRNNISGTWHIDPSLPRPSSQDRIGRISRRFRRASDLPPNVAFSSRHGAIRASLALSGTSLEFPKALMRMTTRTSNMHIDVFQKGPERYFDIDAYSRRGNIIVLLPHNFKGMIELSSRRGRMDILPSLAKTARILKATDDRLLILVGAIETSPSDSILSDHGQLYSRSGNLCVGLSGQDTAPVPEMSLWKKLEGLFSKDHVDLSQAAPL